MVTAEEKDQAEYEKRLDQTHLRNKRDAPLAYPYHIKNYKVNPFKETDWADFWAQVKYDWDTDEFERVRQKIGKGLKRIFRSPQTVRHTLTKKYGRKQPEVHQRKDK